MSSKKESNKKPQTFADFISSKMTEVDIARMKSEEQSIRKKHANDRKNNEKKRTKALKSKLHDLKQESINNQKQQNSLEINQHKNENSKCITMLFFL
jgi:hypothetical protein